MPAFKQMLLAGVLMLLFSASTCYGDESKIRTKRDKFHHHGPHQAPSSGFDFHGFQHPPLIIEDLNRQQQQPQSGGGYGYKPPSTKYGVPLEVSPLSNNGGDWASPPSTYYGPPPSPQTGYYAPSPFFQSCPRGCVPADERLIPPPSTSYGVPTVPYYADQRPVGPVYPPDVLDYPTIDENGSNEIQPTQAPPPVQITTAKPSGPNTLPPFITPDMLEVARNFGFEIIPGKGTPPTQDDVNRALKYLPEGVSFSLVPMNIQDAYFAGQVDFREIDFIAKRHAQLQSAIAARKKQ